MHYTVHHDEAIDTRIASDVSMIRERLLAMFPQIEAIVLVGGFGRGEGSVLVEEDGNITPINDYDLVIISSNPLSSEVVSRIRKELATELGIRWVDISNYTLAQLKHLRYRMYTYDLKYGSQVIYGDASILSLIPDMQAEEMPLIEAEIELFTRLWCFLGPFHVRFAEQQPTDEENFFLANQLSKALLACSDALLIPKGLYDHSFAERLRRFEKTFQDKTDLLPLIREATEFKLRPTREIHYDVIERWFQVRRVFLDTMWDFVNQMYGRKLTDWQHYAWWYEHNPRTLLRRSYHSVIRRNRGYRKRLHVSLLQLYLLIAFERSGTSQQWLRLAKERATALTEEDYLPHSWDQMRQLAAELRMEI